jgi:outer membrane protein
MKAILALTAVTALAAMAAPAPGQDAPRKVARLGIVDIDRIGTQCLLGKSYAAQIQGLNDEIEAERKRKQVELERMDREIRALQEELDRQGVLLSEDVAARKRQEIRQKARDRKAFFDDGTAEIERLRRRAQEQGDRWSAELRARIQPHVEYVARRQGVDILLDSGSALAVAGTFDVSNDVLVRMDEQERPAPEKAAAK